MHCKMQFLLGFEPRLQLADVQAVLSRTDPRYQDLAGSLRRITGCWDSHCA